MLCQFFGFFNSILPFVFAFTYIEPVYRPICCFSFFCISVGQIGLNKSSRHASIGTTSSALISTLPTLCGSYTPPSAWGRELGLRSLLLCFLLAEGSVCVSTTTTERFVYPRNFTDVFFSSSQAPAALPTAPPSLTTTLVDIAAHAPCEL